MIAASGRQTIEAGELAKLGARKASTNFTGQGAAEKRIQAGFGANGGWGRMILFRCG